MRRWLMILLALPLLAWQAPLTAAAGRGPAERSFTVVYQSGAVPPGAAQQLQQTGAVIINDVPQVGVVQVQAPVTALPALQQLPGVQAVSPTMTWRLPVEKAKAFTANDAAVAPGDLYQKYQWDIKQVTHDGASWAIDPGSHATVVGLIDSGVNLTHPDLLPNLVGGSNFVPAFAYGDPTETGLSTDIGDRLGHGSHVAGAVAGHGRIDGVGPGLGYRVYRVFGADGWAETPWITAAIVTAANDGVDVISMSLSGFDVLGKVTWTDPATGITYDLGNDHADFIAWKRAVEYALKQGAVVVASAGNEAIDGGDSKALIAYLNATYGPLGYHFAGKAVIVPASLPGVMTVAATGPTGSPASYTNYGRGYIDIAAPGGDFQRYPAPGWWTDMTLSAYYKGPRSYAWMAGTSMAAPKVAATAALYIDQYRATHDGNRPKPEATVRAVLAAASPAPRGAQAYYGHGNVDAYTTLTGRQQEAVGQ